MNISALELARYLTAAAALGAVAASRGVSIEVVAELATVPPRWIVRSHCGLLKDPIASDFNPMTAMNRAREEILARL
jgi:hypothetical protein